MQIGNKLKRLRELKNLNQEEVAKKLNITKQAYSKIERNETKLDLDRIVDLAEIFDIKPEELFNEESINISIAKECEAPNQQNSGNLNTTYNYYYGNEAIPILQKTIDNQQETIKRLESEITYLRKLLEAQIDAQNKSK